MPYLAATDRISHWQSGSSSYKNATVMFQLFGEENTTLVNGVQSWQGTTIEQQRLWVLLPTAVKILLNELFSATRTE